MDAALYLSLRDEIQQDAARVERQLEELRRAESFLLHRIHSTNHLASYRVVLQDLSLAIARSEADHSELLHLSRFVTHSLITAYGKKDDSAIFAKSAPQTDEPPKPVAETAKASPLPEPSQPPATKTKEPEKSNGLAALAQQSPLKTDVPPAPLKSAIVEFDKDGFPIVAVPRKSSSTARSPSALTFQETPTNAEPPTVVFDENGFPLNPPTDESLNTLMELPKPQSATNEPK